jgi:hypothetical protein
MVLRKCGIFMLGLASIAIPARATISYQSTQGSFSFQAGTTDGLTVSPTLITFTGTGLTESTVGTGNVAGDEYLDSATGVEFLAFTSNGMTPVAFASVTGGALETTPGAGDAIEVLLPSGTDGFAFNFTASSFDNLCIDFSVSTFSTCANGGATAPSFSGLLNDGPPSTLPTLWIHPGSFSPGTDLQNFEVATESPVPESSTMFMIGGGLVAMKALGAIRRRRLSQAV